MFLAKFFITVFALIVAGLLVARYVFGVQPAAIGEQVESLVRPAVPFVQRHRKKFILLALVLAPLAVIAGAIILALVIVVRLSGSSEMDSGVSKIDDPRYYEDNEGPWASWERPASWEKASNWERPASWEKKGSH